MTFREFLVNMPEWTLKGVKQFLPGSAPNPGLKPSKPFVPVIKPKS